MFRQGSDHAPLHMVCKTAEENIIKPFRFQKFWTKHKEVKSIVQNNWVVDFKGCPFQVLQTKLKRVKKALLEWSIREFGNIFVKKATLEDMISVKETKFELDRTPENRAQLHKVEADLKRFLKLEEEFWKQKAGMKWFIHGDRNTKFFHSYVQGRRRKLHLHEISDDNGHLLNTQTAIGLLLLNFLRISLKRRGLPAVGPCWNISQSS